MKYCKTAEETDRAIVVPMKTGIGDIKVWDDSPSQTLLSIENKMYGVAPEAFIEAAYWLEERIDRQKTQDIAEAVKANKQMDGGIKAYDDLFNSPFSQLTAEDRKAIQLSREVLLGKSKSELKLEIYEILQRNNDSGKKSAMIMNEADEVLAWLQK